MAEKGKTSKWDEAAIRAELARLDGITHLNGAALPIRFGSGRSTLGYFGYPSSGECYFRFSLYYYGDPDWPDEEALDTIRHEYAHYMDYVRHGHSGHGAAWKACCREIGALPQRLYDKSRAEYYTRLHKREAEEAARFSSAYAAGGRIVHPRYGVGVIEEVTVDAATHYALIRFGEAGTKKLDLAWVEKNCKPAG